MTDVKATLPEPPSTRQLVQSTIIAAVVATVLLVTVVFPAEYGRDPTGIGRVLGLTEMGEIKLRLAREAEAQRQAPKVPSPVAAAPSPAGAPPHPTETPAAATETPPAATETPPAVTVAPASSRTDVTSITFQPNEGKEIKLAMRQGARVTFSWATDRGVVNYDLHADSVDPPRDYHGYRKGKGVPSDEGVLEAAFDGWHGWHWRNKTAEAVTVTLRTSGEYQDIKELK